MSLYPGVYSLKQQLQSVGQLKWPGIDVLAMTGLPGLAGKFFNYQNTTNLYAGTVGGLPLTTTNESSNVSGSTGMPSAAYRYGVNLWPYISYGAAGTSIGDYYSFIAIGYFKPPTTGSYTFYIYSDDSAAMWLGTMATVPYGRTSDNMFVLNNSAGSERSNTISLIAGTWYPVRIVHEEVNGFDYLTFSWAGPSIAKTTDLTTYFKAPAVDGVLTGNYL